MTENNKHEYDGLMCDVCNKKVTCVTNLKERGMFVCYNCLNYVNLIE